MGYRQLASLACHAKLRVYVYERGKLSLITNRLSPSDESLVAEEDRTKVQKPSYLRLAQGGEA